MKNEMKKRLKKINIAILIFAFLILVANISFADFILREGKDFSSKAILAVSSTPAPTSTPTPAPLQPPSSTQTPTTTPTPTSTPDLTPAPAPAPSTTPKPTPNPDATPAPTKTPAEAPTPGPLQPPSGMTTPTPTPTATQEPKETNPKDSTASGLISSADQFIKNGANSGENTINMDRVSESFTNMGGLLAGIGVIVLLAVTGIMGIKFMMASPDQRAGLQKQLVGLVIAAVVIFGAFTIWSTVVRVMFSTTG